MQLMELLHYELGFTLQVAFQVLMSCVCWQIAKLQDDNRALDRLTKSKEAALLVAERTVQTAEAKASMVDDLQNRNQELMKQIEICQVVPLFQIKELCCHSQGAIPCLLY
jgi:hypothetical protein